MQRTKRITQNNKTLIILMLDQSGSMQEFYGGESQEGAPPPTKADVVASCANDILTELVDRTRQGTVYKHYYDIAVVGYSGKGVYSLLQEDMWLMSPVELSLTISKKVKVLQRVKSASGRQMAIYKSQKRWVEPYADGTTPMCEALGRVCELIYTWQKNQKDKEFFAPTIINITDGELTDANEAQVTDIVKRLKSLGRGEDQSTLINFHISSSSAQGAMFPVEMEELPREAHLLYELSSDLPEFYNKEVAQLKGESLGEGVVYRGITYNLPQGDFIRAIQIGTTTTDQLYL